MYAMNALHYSIRKKHQQEWKIYKKLLQHMNKKTDPETAFKNLNQGEKVLSPNYVYHNLFHAISGR